MYCDLPLLLWNLAANAAVEICVSCGRFSISDWDSVIFENYYKFAKDPGNIFGI
jgi:hypothetical protein